MVALVRLLLTLVTAVICFWPALLYWFADTLLDPSGFWQNFVLLGVGVWVLGAVQIGLFFLFCIALFFIWTFEA